MTKHISNVKDNVVEAYKAGLRSKKNFELQKNFLPLTAPGPKILWRTTAHLPRTIDNRYNEMNSKLKMTFIHQFFQTSFKIQ